VVDLHAKGKLPATTGFVRQERVPLPQFLGNRFGAAYAGAEHAGANGRKDDTVHATPASRMEPSID